MCVLFQFCMYNNTKWPNEYVEIPVTIQHVVSDFNKVQLMYPDTFETQHSVFWEHKLPPAGSWVLDPWDPDLGLHQGQLPIGLRPPPAGMGAQISWRCVALGLLYSWGLWMVRFCLWLLGHYCGFLIFKYISCERHIHSPNLSLFFSLTLTQTPQRKTCLSFLRHCHTVTTYSVITEIG